MKLTIPFDLSGLPDHYLDRRAVLILRNAQQRAQLAAKFMKDAYAQRTLLDHCHTFIFNDIYDVPRSDLTLLRRVWFFPWLELQRDLSEAITHCLLGSYKSAYDNCRRALEMAVVGAYFIQEHVSQDSARAWMKSEGATPMFNRAITALLRGKRFSALDATTQWASHVRSFYWRLCDVVHVRGVEASYRVVQPSHTTISDVSLPEYSAEALSKTLDMIIDTVRHIATVAAIENPVLLVGLPLSEKFGLNPPLSGFFEHGQAELLRRLLVPECATAVIEMAMTDGEVHSASEWVNGMPDITHEELEQQIASQNEQLGRGPATSG